jgi:hypothetical protein
MTEEPATASRVINEFRKLFQKNDEWKASIYREGTNLEISLLTNHLTASWGGGGFLPHSCTNLAAELGWHSPGSGTFDGALFKAKLYPKGG